MKSKYFQNPLPTIVVVLSQKPQIGMSVRNSGQQFDFSFDNIENVPNGETMSGSVV